MKKAVITFGRFNPMTVGHEKLVNKVKDVSKKISGDPHIYLSHTQDKKRNPLDYNTKVKLAQRAFGSAVKKSRARTIIEIMKELEKKKYTDVHLVVGSDRVKEFDTLLQKYNGKDYTFDSIKVESAGDRDPDAEGISGMSATKMRLAAKSDDLPRFKSGAPSKLSDKEIKLMYDKVQAVLEELENITIDDDIFQVSDVEIEAVIEMTELDDEDISEFDIDEAKKPLSVAQRAKIARRMKKMAPKMKMKKALAAKRMATPAQLEKRAKKAAINLVRKKFAGKAGANYASLSPSAKIGVDKIISKKMGAVNKIAKKMMPGIKKKEQERIKALRSKKEEVQMDNNVNEIFNEIMTTRYKGKIVANQIFKTQLKAFAFASKHGGKVIRTGKEFRVTVPRQSGPRSRTWDLDDNAKMSLMQKASRNDIPFEIIQEVFERGLEEYDITPRESQDRVQWGFARVNSFLTNGTRKAVDADLWEQAMDILPEGPNDPAIFKAVFLAGGPGSGKSFIAGKAGLRSFGFKLINPDPAFENALKKAGLEMSAKDIYSKQGQEVRKAARQLTDKQTEMAIHNRLGLLVDGTGKDFNKIAKLKSMVEKKGYESYLLAVNTDLETAIKRNRMRSRKLPDEKVKEMWFAVQNNMDKFGKLFGKNFLAVTNNDEDNPSKQSMIAYKKIGSWSKTPPKSQKAQNWIKAALDARKTRREEVEDNLNEVYVLVHNNRIVDKGNKSQMHLARLKLKKKTGETDHKKLFVGLKGTKTQFADIGAKWKEEVEIKEIYKGKETVAVVKGKPNDIAKARDKLQNSLDTMYNVIGPHNVSVDIDAIDRYVDKLDRLVIKGDRAGAWAMNLVKNNRKLKADYKFDFGSRKQKSGMMKMGEDIQEAILKVDNFDDSKIRRIGRAKSDLKQLGLQMRVQRGQGSEPDSDYAIFKGDEKNLVAYAQKWLGTTSDNLEDCQSDLDGNTNLLANEKTPDEKFENLMEDQYTRVLDAIGKHLNHRAYMAALDVYKKKTVGKKDPHRSMTATKIAQTFRGVEPKPFVDFINSLIDKGKLPREIHARYTDTSMYEQAEYQGKKVKLNDPIRTDENPNKKFKVYVKNENDEVVVVRFGDPNMDIKRDDAGSRASFRARHNCDNPGPKWKARYWSCYQWRANAPVNNEFTPD